MRNEGLFTRFVDLRFVVVVVVVACVSSLPGRVVAPVPAFFVVVVTFVVVVIFVFAAIAAANVVLPTTRLAREIVFAAGAALHHTLALPAAIEVAAHVTESVVAAIAPAFGLEERPRLIFAQIAGHLIGDFRGAVHALQTMLPDDARQVLFALPDAEVLIRHVAATVVAHLTF